MESALDSCLGANGAIYAVRSELCWREVPDNTIVDDFVIGMKVRESGSRMIYEPAAVAEEEFPAVTDEWRRRVRIGMGDYQALSLCRKCLGPRYGAFAWMFWSHKVLRWFMPHIMLLLIGASMLLVFQYGPSVCSRLPAAVIAGTALLIACSVVGLLPCLPGGPVSRFFRMCDHFVTMNCALLAGFFRFLAGDVKGYWERTPRN